MCHLPADSPSLAAHGTQHTPARRSQRGGKQFEWYGDWPQMAPLVRTLLAGDRASHSVLMVGCGNSELSANMYDDGFENITNIDFSKVLPLA